MGRMRMLRTGRQMAKTKSEERFASSPEITKAPTVTARPWVQSQKVNQEDSMEEYSGTGGGNCTASRLAGTAQGGSVWATYQTSSTKTTTLTLTVISGESAGS
jgi:hypothetical protein